VAALLGVCAACLAGCAGSSSSGAAVSGGGGIGDYAGATGAGGSGPSGSDPTAFAPTTATPPQSSTAASQAADKLTSVAKPGNSAYKIGPLDVLEVTVFKVPDLTKTVQVAEDGNINYPLVGDVEAAGKTAQEVERDLSRKLGAKYLRDPQVTVFVKEYNSQRVTVEGSVKTSGVYSIKGNTSLMQVVAMAGDIDPSMDSGEVVVFRMVDGSRSVARFNIDDIKAGKAEDPPMQPGDVIVVDTSETKVALHNVLTALPLATSAAVFRGL
jgi:polysaccharide export outer membrane protein